MPSREEARLFKMEMNSFEPLMARSGASEGRRHYDLLVGSHQNPLPQHTHSGDGIGLALSIAAYMGLSQPE